MKLYTIGFTQKSAESFFDLLQQNGVQRVIDIRLRPNSQLAGFGKKEDLAYFLSRLIDCEYYHLEALAPTDEILSQYRKDHDWDRYEQSFNKLMDARDIPESLDASLFTTRTSCLLCSEALPDKCHRSLVAKRLTRRWPDLEIVHLV